MYYKTEGELITAFGGVKVYHYMGQYYLEIDNTLWAETSEIKEYKEQIGTEPYGNVLEIGLGLGVASNYILSLDQVSQLTTVEVNKDVIRIYKRMYKICSDSNTNHTIVHSNGIDYMLSLSSNTFDFIFFDFYNVIDEDTLLEIEDYARVAKQKLTKSGKVSGWFDIYAEEYEKEFYSIFERA